MINILFRCPIALQHRELLRQEFSQCHFIFFEELEEQFISPDIWRDVEILYGDELLPQELSEASLLRWIHSPARNMDRLCLNPIHERGNILLTYPGEENIPQIAEFVISAIMAFTKQLFQWKCLGCKSSKKLWTSDLKYEMWFLEDHELLQIGLGKVGSEIAKCAKHCKLKVRGVYRRRSFHPYCEKVVAEEDLHSMLPSADIVCLSLPCSERYDHWFGREELELIKDDSIFVIIGCGRVVDGVALEEVAASGKFRGIVIDAFNAKTLSKNSPLWKLPNVLVTPNVANYPLMSSENPIWSFCRNLRHYLHGNYEEMQGTIDWSIYS